MTVDIYRGFTPGSPYPAAPTPDVAGVQGFIRHHLKNGVFGLAAQGLHWTHLLYLPLGTDIRSAYDSQLTPEVVQNTDTILAHDYPRTGWCTAFAAVMVQRFRAGGDFLKVYLDRCQPIHQPCGQPAHQSNACQCEAYVARYVFSLSTIAAGTGDPFTSPCPACAGWDVAWTLDFLTGLGYPAWLGPNSPCREGSPINLPIDLRQLGSGLGSIYQLRLPQDYNPDDTVYYDAPCETWNCLGPNVLTLQAGPRTNVRCQGWPATITLTPA